MRFRLLALVLTAGALPTLDAQEAPPAPVTKVTADFGYVTTSGNTSVTTLSAGEKLTHTRGRWVFDQTFNLVYGEQNGVTNTSFIKASLRGDFRIDRLFAFFAGTAFDRNAFAGIERRFEEIVGLQMRALAAPRDTIRIEAGANFVQQTAVDGTQQNFPAARGSAVWRHRFTAASYFQQNLEVIPNLKEQEDWRINTESSLVAPISQRIGIKLSYVIRYDNVPEPGFRTTDRLFTSGIQVAF